VITPGQQERGRFKAKYDKLSSSLIAGAFHPASQPPSTTMTVPVVNDEESPARCSVARGFPNRLRLGVPRSQLKYRKQPHAK
jgi:hypothetical protein